RAHVRGPARPIGTTEHRARERRLSNAQQPVGRVRNEVPPVGAAQGARRHHRPRSARPERAASHGTRPADRAELGGRPMREHAALELFSLAIRHAYFEERRCRVFDVTPSSACRRLLERYRLVWAPATGGGSVYVWSREDEAIEQSMFARGFDDA